MDNNEENKNQIGEDKNDHNQDPKEKRPWYLSDVFLTLICIFLPPIGYIVILSNRKKWSHEKYIGFLAIATFTMALFLIKFLPGKWGDIIFLTGAGIFIYHKILKKMNKD